MWDLGSTPASGVAGRASRPAVRAWSLIVVEAFSRADEVFREGAENSARGGRAPYAFFQRFLCFLRLFAAIDGAKRGGGCEFPSVWLEAGFGVA
jgi:hypothetical protein